MKRVFITGLSGTGKSSVIVALAARGYRAIDLDAPEWSELTRTPGADVYGRGTDDDWTWREDAVSRLLDDERGDVLFVSGGATNQPKFYPRFDHVVLLSAPEALMTERMRTRTTNAYGKDPRELARQLALKTTVEPLLRRRADLEIDTSTPLGDVVEAILRHVA